jgi:hypothetical protein
VVNGVGEEFDIDCGVGDNGGGDGTGDIVVVDAGRTAGAGGDGFFAAVDGPEEPVPMQDFGLERDVRRWSRACIRGRGSLSLRSRSSN